MIPKETEDISTVVHFKVIKVSLRCFLLLSIWSLQPKISSTSLYSLEQRGMANMDFLEEPFF
jgi:hypothetical protein